MEGRERFLWIGLSVILVVLAAGLLFKNTSYKSQLNLAQQREQTRVSEIEDLKQSLTQAQQQIEKLSKSQSNRQRQETAQGLQDTIKDYRSQLSLAQQREKIMATEVKGLKQSLTQAQRQIERLSQSQSGLQSWDIESLKKKGLQNPVQEIKADLMKHNELIPYKGALGGKMGFYDEDAIQIVSPKWVFATFDDGHIVGHTLLEYRVSNEGRISWKVLDSYLEE